MATPKPGSAHRLSFAERLRKMFRGDPAEVDNPRRAFLRRSAFGLAAVPAVLATVSVGAGRAKADDPVNDESLGETFAQIQDHENEHVAFLENALGSNARPKPTFKKLKQSTLEDFIYAAQAFENIGVGAYLGAAPYIENPAYLSAAGSILPIEARHASFLNFILGDPIAAGEPNLQTDHPFETPLTANDVSTAAGAYIKNLNGGPAVTYSTTKSAENDIAILNFALALEYLEADFYNINVPIFYG